MILISLPPQHASSSSIPVPPRLPVQASATESPSSKDSSFKSPPFTPQSDLSKIPSLVDRLRAIASEKPSKGSSSSERFPRPDKDLLPGITLSAQELFTSPAASQFYEAANRLTQHPSDTSGRFSAEQLEGVRRFLDQFWPHRLVYSEVEITAKNAATARQELADFQAAALQTANFLTDGHAEVQALRTRNEAIVEDLKVFNAIIGWLSSEARANSAKVTRLEEQLAAATARGETDGGNCANSLAEVARMEGEWSQKVEQRQAMSEAYAALQQLLGVKP